MKFIDWALKFTRTAGAYRRVFKNSNFEEDIKIILADLAKQAPSDPVYKVAKPYDEKEVFIYIGRRQLLNHIVGMIAMTEAQINKIIKDAQAKDENPNNIKGM